MTKSPKHEAKSHCLLTNGIKLFWSKGYNGTSVNDIVKEAEVPKGSFYFYFKSKEDFALKAIEAYKSENLDPVLELLNDANLSPKERLIAFYEFRENIIKNDMNCKWGCLAINLSNEMAEHSLMLKEALHDLDEGVKKTITKVVVEAQEAGEADASIDAREFVEFVENAGKGAMITMKESNSAFPIENLLVMIKKILFK